MNEQILELTDKAIEDIPGDWNIPDQFCEKFAQLIIQNCISQISLIGISNFENDDITWTVEKSIANIKEHFGVK